MSPPKIPVKDRLLKHVKKVDGPLDSQCWEWQSSKHTGKFKYGVVWVGGRNGHYYLAHRMSYQEFIGPIPDGMSVLHKCDNPPCINPDHLFAGTNGENCTDCAAKDRHARGSRSGNSKLTEADIPLIRAATGTLKEIGKEFGIDASMVGYIKRGNNWKHVK